MTAEEVLRLNEESAIDNNQIVFSGSGQGKKKSPLKLKKGFGAVIFITLVLVVFLVFFSAGNLIPTAISERLIEETDVQYTDAVQMKTQIFQQTLAEGKVPTNTIARLKNAGVLVGNGGVNDFQESENGTSLKMGDKVISASQFSSAVMSDARLYDAFTGATYGRAAYYYDDAAETVFKQQGISRNNYKNNGKSFDEVMNGAVGKGNSITVGEGDEAVTCKNSDGEIAENEDEAVLCSVDTVVSEQSAGSDAGSFVSAVGEKNSDGDAASTLSIADSIATEQKSSAFYVGLMENISKMKAGDGSDSKINEAMNYLYQDSVVEVVDVTSGEVKQVTGSALEAPSLYALLSGERLDVNNVANYSTERVLKTVENQQLGGESVGYGALLGSYTSTDSGVRGTIGRIKSSGSSSESLQAVTPIINSSLVDNSFESIKGVNAGELLVQGAVNVGASLALQSGATAGGAEEVAAYRRATDAIIALEAEVDRLHRSPLDITSKNTFLGSIVYKFAISTMKSGTFLNKVASISRVTASSISSVLPSVHADDKNDSYMTNYGNCERMESIGAVGTAGCSRNETFDMSTINISDPTFISVMNENIEASEDGTYEVKKGSTFEKFIRYNVGRITPLGVTDGGILKALDNKDDSGTENASYGKIPFISKVSDLLSTVWKKIVNLFTGENDHADIATGAAFVNSKDNRSWDEYKYAQRYVSMVRATKALQMYDGGQTAYNNIPYVGTGNPVLACLEKYYQEMLAMNGESVTSE